MSDTGITALHSVNLGVTDVVATADFFTDV